MTSGNGRDARPHVGLPAGSGLSGSPGNRVSAGKNTPADIIEKLNREVNAGLVLPRIKSRIEEMGATVLPGSPADFGRLIADETEKWGKVVRASGAKPD